MVKIIMHGCCGHMGQVISQIVKEDADAQIVAGIDPFDNGKMEYPVYKSLEDCKEEADVVIDFASAKAEDALLDYCGAHKLPVVVCTTGLSEEQLQKVAETAKKTAVLKSANMSLGINLLLKILQDAAKVLSPAGYDIELVEKHHNQKLDQLIILPDVFKTKDLIVDHLFVCGLAFCPATGVPDELAKFLLAQREILAIYLFIEPEAIWTDPTPIPEAETPEVDALSLLGPHPHTDGSILLCTGLSELQVQITGGLLLRVVAQQIKFHFTIPGAEGIQTLWTSVPIQNKGDKTLGGNGFASGVISPQQDMSVLKGELLLVVQPKVEKSQFIHLPAAHCTPTLPIRFDKRRGSAQPACPQPDRAKYPCPAPPEASNWPCMRSTLD